MLQVKLEANHPLNLGINIQNGGSRCQMPPNNHCIALLPFLSNLHVESKGPGVLVKNSSCCCLAGDSAPAAPAVHAESPRRARPRAAAPAPGPAHVFRGKAVPAGGTVVTRAASPCLGDDADVIENLQRRQSRRRPAGKINSARIRRTFPESTVRRRGPDRGTVR